MALYTLANIPIQIDGKIPSESEWNRFSTADGPRACARVAVRRSSENACELTGDNPSRQCFVAAPNSYLYSLNAAIYEMCVQELLRQHVIHLHSSFVLYHGRGILFTGPSGVGKTTQAELWRDHQGAEIVNGDVSLIRKWEGRYCAFGAPVHGASPYCENKSAPIAAVIVLRQGQENRLEPLNSYDTLSHCLPEIYRPAMPEETQDILWDTIHDFFSRIPVCRLTCRPDRDATELVKRELGL